MKKELTTVKNRIKKLKDKKALIDEELEPLFIREEELENEEIIAICRKNNITISDLIAKVNRQKAADERQNLQDKIKVIDKEMQELSAIMEQVHTVKKYRQYYKEYKANPSDKTFFEEYKVQITLYENAKEELKKPFEKADELKTKVLRLAELNKLLDMGEVEEKRNDNPLVEDVKRAIIDFCNREYEENHSYDEFNTLYPDLKHIGIAYTNTPDERHGIQYELDLEEKTWTQYIDDTPIKTESFDYENKGENEALRNMKNEMEMSSFNDLVYVDSEDLRTATGLDIDDEGNFYDSLSKDFDNDGIPDRYDNDFKDSDYFESTYDVEDNLHSKEETAQKSYDKPSILGQIRAYQNESKTEEKQKTKEQEILR